MSLPRDVAAHLMGKNRVSKSLSYLAYRGGKLKNSLRLLWQWQWQGIKLERVMCVMPRDHPVGFGELPEGLQIKEWHRFTFQKNTVSNMENSLEEKNIKPRSFRR